MYIQPSASTGTLPNASAGQAIAFPSAMGQPQGDIYTSSNDKALAKKRALNPVNIAVEALLGGMIGLMLKGAGKNKLALGAFLGFPLAGMGLRALGAMFDSEWDKKHPPNTQKGAIWHEVLRPSGLADLLLIGAGILTLKGNVSGLKQGGWNTLDSVINLDWLLLSPGVGIWDRYKEGKEKFAISGRGRG